MNYVGNVDRWETLRERLRSPENQSVGSERIYNPRDRRLKQKPMNRLARKGFRFDSGIMGLVQTNHSGESLQYSQRLDTGDSSWPKSSSTS